MDLAIGAKLVSECSYPLTGLRCVSRVCTEFATFGISTSALETPSVDLRRRSAPSVGLG